MKKILLGKLFAIALVLGVFVAAAPAQASTPVTTVTAAPDSLVQTVRYHYAPRYYGRPHYYGRRYYRPYRYYARPRYYGRGYYQ